MDRKDVLRKRFAKADPGSKRGRRKDYKGKRVALNLRVQEDVLERLWLIRTAGGEDVNTFCQSVLAEATLARVEELRRGFDDGGWAVIVQCAKANTSGKRSG